MRSSRALVPSAERPSGGTQDYLFVVDPLQRLAVLGQVVGEHPLVLSGVKGVDAGFRPRSARAFSGPVWSGASPGSCRRARRRKTGGSSERRLKLLRPFRTLTAEVRSSRQQAMQI